MINRARKLWVETGLPPRGKRKDAVPLMGFSIFVVARLGRQNDAALVGGDVAQHDEEMPDSDDTKRV
jgi:hypothetical protein